VIDKDGGVSSIIPFVVTVRYNFTGFFQPIDNLPALNSVMAGKAIPVKFKLKGDQGLGIFAAKSPSSQQITCATTAPIDPVEDTVTAGASRLDYDASIDQYTYIWKTNNAWANTCRRLTITFVDGTSRSVDFKFTK
jgi:hypothetical protein